MLKISVISESKQNAARETESVRKYCVGKWREVASISEIWKKKIDILDNVVQYGEDFE